jgi:hypothetical protein
MSWLSCAAKATKHPQSIKDSVPIFIIPAVVTVSAGDRCDKGGVHTFVCVRVYVCICVCVCVLRLRVCVT